MPALRACGRSWEFGSDDLVFPGLLIILIRLIWLLLQVRILQYSQYLSTVIHVASSVAHQATTHPFMTLSTVQFTNICPKL